MLTQAVAVLRQGGVVLHATEGVWGLACDPHQAAAVEKIFALKQRSADKGLLLLGANPAFFARQLCGVPHRQQILASWPGPDTWLLPNQGEYADAITGGRDTVACRVPGHAQARRLCAAFNATLVSTSANISGQAAAVEEVEARKLFADKVDFVLSGQVGDAGRASTIHALDGSIIRP